MTIKPAMLMTTSSAKAFALATRLARRMFLFMACAVMAIMGMLSLSACGWWGDYETFSQEQAQAAIQRTVPYQHSFDLFDVTLDHPNVMFSPEDNGISVQFNVHTVIKLEHNQRQPADGTITVSSGLAWDAAKHAIVMHSPKVDEVELLRSDNQAWSDAVASAFSTAVATAREGGVYVPPVPEEALAPTHRYQVEDALTSYVTALLAGYPVYTLTPDQLKRMANHRPGDITVRGDSVRMQIMQK